MRLLYSCRSSLRLQPVLVWERYLRIRISLRHLASSSLIRKIHDNFSSEVRPKNELTSLIGKTNDGRVSEEWRTRCFRKMTSIVFCEETRKPRSVAHADIMFKVCWRSLAALDGLEDRRDRLKSLANRHWVRENATYLLISLIASWKRGTLHISPRGTPSWMGTWVDSLSSILTVMTLS